MKNPQSFQLDSHDNEFLRETVDKVIETVETMVHMSDAEYKSNNYRHEQWDTNGMTCKLWHKNRSSDEPRTYVCRFDIKHRSVGEAFEAIVTVAKRTLDRNDVVCIVDDRYPNPYPGSGTHGVLRLIDRTSDGRYRPLISARRLVEIQLADAASGYLVSTDAHHIADEIIKRSPSPDVHARSIINALLVRPNHTGDGVVFHRITCTRVNGSVPANVIHSKTLKGVRQLAVEISNELQQNSAAPPSGDTSVGKTSDYG